MGRAITGPAKDTKNRILLAMCSGYGMVIKSEIATSRFACEHYGTIPISA